MRTVRRYHLACGTITTWSFLTTRTMPNGVSVTPFGFLISRNHHTLILNLLSLSKLMRNSPVGRLKIPDSPGINPIKTSRLNNAERAIRAGAGRGMQKIAGRNAPKCQQDCRRKCTERTPGSAEAEWRRHSHYAKVGESATTLQAFA